MEAANLLKGAGRFRSSVSRSYFAAYGLFTHRLPLDPVPKHQHVRGLARRHLTSLMKMEISELSGLLKSLQDARVAADYDRHEDVTEAHAQSALSGVARLLELLEAADG